MSALPQPPFPNYPSPGPVRPLEAKRRGGKGKRILTWVAVGVGALIVLVVRTKRRLLTTPPSLPLAIATACAIVAALAMPFTPVAPMLGFSAVSARFVGAMALIVLLYLVAAEAAKRFFYRLRDFRR